MKQIGIIRIKVFRKPKSGPLKNNTWSAFVLARNLLIKSEIEIVLTILHQDEQVTQY